MGIWNRLESVIKSYFASEDEAPGKGSFKRQSDPDLNAAYEELDDLLNGKEKGEKFKAFEEEAGKKKKTVFVSETIKKDFEELGLTPEASAEECKEAYKRLLKIHHPDHHANHEGNRQKATEK